MSDSASKRNCSSADPESTRTVVTTVIEPPSSVLRAVANQRFAPWTAARHALSTSVAGLALGLALTVAVALAVAA